MKSIVLAVDLSMQTRKAFDQAINLAKTYQSTLVIVHAFEHVLNSTYFAGPGGVKTIEEVNQRNLEEAARRLTVEWAELARSEDVQVETEFDAAYPAHFILQAADTHDADLIVLATHGYRGWKRFVLGSVCEELIRTSKRPILAIPADADIAND